MYPGERLPHASAVPQVASAEICSGKSGGVPSQMTFANLSYCPAMLEFGTVTVVSAAFMANCPRLGMRLSSGSFSFALRMASFLEGSQGSHQPQRHLVLLWPAPDTAAPRDGTTGLLYLVSPSGSASSGLILKEIFIVNG